MFRWMQRLFDRLFKPQMIFESNPGDPFSLFDKTPFRLGERGVESIHGYFVSGTVTGSR